MPYKNKEDRARNIKEYRKTYIMPPYTRKKKNKAQARFQKSEKGKTVHLKRMYGITFEDKRTLYRQQRGLCALCHLRLPGISQAHTDHDHKTKVIRGLLHRICNFVVGVFEKQKINACDINEYLKRCVIAAKTGDYHEKKKRERPQSTSQHG